MLFVYLRTSSIEQSYFLAYNITYNIIC